jgi:peptidoglycan hydrolase-like amidase
MFYRILAITIIVISLGGCVEWGPDDKIVAVEHSESGRQTPLKSVVIVYRKADGTIYRKHSNVSVTDGINTVNPEDYLNGKVPYGSLPKQ